MPTWTKGRLRLLIFISLLVATALAAASFVYFRAGPRVPEGADVVEGSGMAPATLPAGPMFPGPSTELRPAPAARPAVSDHGAASAVLSGTSSPTSDPCGSSRTC